MRALFKIVVVLMILTSVSCKKKYEVPDPLPAPPVSGFISIDSIQKRYLNYYVKVSAAPTKFYRFASDLNLECTVTADEASGNIYKTVYVEDATGGLTIKLLESGGLAVGDKIRINLNNVILNDYGGTIQLDSIDLGMKVAKLSSGNAVTPVKTTYNQLLASTVYTRTFGDFTYYPFQSRLVVLDSVQFSIGDKGKPYADAVGKNSIDRMLENSLGATPVSVRSSGYASFASNITPCGKGKITVIATQYNQDLQFIIRDISEVQMTAGGCPVQTYSFDGPDVFVGGWSNVQVSGSDDWYAGAFGTRKYINISNGGSGACETWLISPAFDIATASNPGISFESAYNFSGPALEVYVSTDYSSGLPSSATWVLLNPLLSTGSFSWRSSGFVNLNAHKSSNTRIGFKYTGTSTAGSRWEIDNFALFKD